MKRIFKLLTAFLFLTFAFVTSADAQFIQVRPNAAIDGFMQVDFRECIHPAGFGFRMVDDSGNDEARTAIWRNNTIDLTNGFTANFSIRFTDNDGGADGMTFALQNAGPSSVGMGGGFLGFGVDNGATPRTLGVEFDVHQNSPDNRFVDTIPLDHTGLYFNSDMSNPITPVTPLGNGDIEDGNWHQVQVVWDACNMDFDVFFEGAHVVDYTGDIINNVFDGNPFVFWGFTAGKWLFSSDIDVCITDIIIDNTPCCDNNVCEVETDLTACAAEGDYGFVSLKCDAQFEWRFPDGSTAMECAAEGQSVVVNMSEGFYEVEITYPDGCMEILEFEVVADCCDNSGNDCPTPQNPRCGTGPNNDYLIWDPVPGATGYCVTISSDFNLYCGCSGPPDTEVYNLTTHVMPVPPAFHDCFVWSVVAKCADGGTSDPTPELCYNGSCSPQDFGGELPNIGSENTNHRSSLYPNPTSGQVHLKIELQQASEVHYEVVDLAGRVVQSLPDEQLTEGIHQKTFSLENTTDNGIYVIRVHYGDGTTTAHKVIVQK